ncbi:antitoxin Xre/MbcA/ParS toxin-binding domain-containing protein [Deinococcus soli (ex Cha et al. 2016)]|uniref:Uncharacterized protein n=2 Tax=Deinococcus soli (ex Cha et al. 2016) TaxID=1309411 RepID=A0ACC6KKK6_9DEIO|nr:antitoxin Xre/MbcA/ParS toxin-binding domain-containing protein [Deinococcus soli (ex Cha et al. 2016)]MDR6218571.1 hypothetical protein [Deinococcus soli (ex Cha et al. 2016)]MDR6328368.1 hypothetical protein [Deinococcus soli (ex Cha et al. 2016)]MDR6752979.1 hypothetical protein [Deinococcus soli (ex Cha et al. 2016)]
MSTPVNLDDPAERARLGGGSLPPVRRILARWGVTGEQETQLLGFAPGTDLGAPVGDFTPAQLRRMSLVVGIYMAVSVLYRPDAVADGFVTRVNAHPLFGGRTPLDVMLSGGETAMVRVRERLDAQLAGHP